MATRSIDELIDLIDAGGTPLADIVDTLNELATQQSQLLAILHNERDSDKEAAFTNLYQRNQALLSTKRRLTLQSARLL